MTPAETIHHLRGSHIRIESPVGHCRKDHQNWPCDTIRALDAATAAERARILVPDETLHADGSIGPDAVPAEFPQDATYWYRRWLFAAKQLDKEANERIRAFVERQHIRQLAETWIAAPEQDWGGEVTRACGRQLAALLDEERP